MSSIKDKTTCESNSKGILKSGLQTALVSFDLSKYFIELWFLYLTYILKI